MVNMDKWMKSERKEALWDIEGILEAEYEKPCFIDNDEISTVLETCQLRDDEEKEVYDAIDKFVDIMGNAFNDCVEKIKSVINCAELDFGWVDDEEPEDDDV